MSETNDTLKNIIGVALGVCLVCSILVSTAAVLLKPRQDANRRLEKLKNVLLAGGLLDKNGEGDIEKIFSEKIQPVMIELKTGEKLLKEKMTGVLDPEIFDMKKMAKDPVNGEKLGKNDPAGIKRKAKYNLLYFVKDGGKVTQVIFPVYGQGLWSIMYGFIAIDRDLQTVKGFTFYEHAETPGLGGEVDNPNWKKLWIDKKIFDSSGQYLLKILKGKAPAGSTSEIDGLSGATITTFGIDRLVKYWLGDDGFGIFIKKLREEGV